MSRKDVGTDHCRVVPVGRDANIYQRVEFCRHFFAYVESIGRFSPQARVLEVGAGEGYGANYVSAYCAGLIATDLSSQALAHAANRYPNVHYCQAFGTALPFSSNALDAVISFQVIEHIVNDAAYLAEVCRVLKPEGKFILTTPNRQWRLLPFQKPINPYHVREYHERQLRRLLNRFFDCVELYGVVAPQDIMEMVRVRRDPIRVYGGMLKRLLAKVLPASLLQHLRTSRHPSPHVDRSVYARSIKSVEVTDFYLSSNAASGLDFFAVARKSG